ncbi:MAG TPA: heavy metal translocating P-type ATPase [Gammaproteobacteria bacterium]|nr:heavy metal translocating P-type ATPase [Gammaproteobacteria bacterium]
MLLTTMIVSGVLYSGFRLYKAKKQASKQTIPIPLVKAKQYRSKSNTSIIKQPSQNMSSVNHINDAVIKARNKLNIFLVSLGLIISGYLIYSPLLLISIFPLLYLVMLRLKTAYTALFIEKRLCIDVVDALWIVGGLANGYYLWVMVGSGIYFISEKILAETEDSSRQNLINVFGEQPRFVWVLVNGVEIETPFEQLQVGDIIVVHASGIIPADGIIRQGIASIDQHRLTGEAQPAEKTVNDSVFASTLVLSGKLHIQVEKTGQETVAAQIGKILNEMSNFTLSLQTQGEKLTDKSTLPTLVLSGIALPLVGSNGALALLGNYPAANLRLLAPMTLLNFLKAASQRGILVKDGRSLELMSKIDTIVFDKTGTLTLEQPQLRKIHLCSLLSENELLSYAATAEYRQTHPVAQAILAAASERQLLLSVPQQAHYEVGYGIKVQLPGKLLRVGSDRFMKMEGISIPANIQAIHRHCHELGNSLIMIAIDDELAGAIELEASLRPEAQKVIEQLQQQGLALYIISGDQEGPTRKLADQLGIQNYFANTLPENKAQLIEKLQQQGKNVCFVGDGINDSIALTQADVSVSLSGASTIATDTAQIVLMDANLERLLDLLQITQALDENMKTNLTVSIIPGVIGIGSVFLFHLGVMTSMGLYALGLFTGVANTMRPMRLYQPYEKIGDRTRFYII